MTVDQKSNRLYLSGPQTSMLIVDLLSGTIIYPPDITKDTFKALDASLVNVNGTIHKLGGVNHCWDVQPTKHCVWNENQQCWDVQPINGCKTFKGFSGNSIYVPSKNIILAIGACRALVPPITHGIWRHCIKSATWRRVSNIKIDTDFSASNCVLTANGDFVVIIGDQWSMECIEVLDIRDDARYKLFRSPIPLPAYGSYHVAVARTGAMPLLTVGWNRRRFKSCPSVIVDLVAKHVNCEAIHWIAEQLSEVETEEYIMRSVPDGFVLDTEKSNHQMIALDDILSSIRPLL